jgi:hypothetical protein
MFIGSNQGNFDEDALFYANDDARKMQVLFAEVGRLDEHLSILITNARINQIRRSLKDLRQRIQLLKKHNPIGVECVVYYSGHGGFDGFHLNGESYSYREFYDDIHSLPCDLLIVVLDACNSGNLLKLKGLSYGAGEFRVKIYDKQGEVFITSSADTEFSQEKDEYKGSIFTHHFAGGLLGAADVNGDNLVSLSEAYNHAFQRTIRETFGSARGFQAPTYKYQVQGRQDPILTELVGKKRHVEVPKNRWGQVTFMDIDKNIIWGDFEISASRQQVVVPQGKYLVRLRTKDGKLYLSKCEVSSSKPAQWEEFKSISQKKDPFKGKRIFHHWTIRLTGGVHLAPQQALLQKTSIGGGMSILLDNLFIPPVYAGISLQVFSGDSSKSILDTDVVYSSTLTSVGAVIGWAEPIGQSLELSCDLRLGIGYVELSRKFLSDSTNTYGWVFYSGVVAQNVIWLSRNIGWILPAVHLNLFTHRQEGKVRGRLDAGGSIGFQLRF